MDRSTYLRWAAKAQVQEDGCILWTGAIISNGYGSLRADSRMQLAHRLAYEHFIGPIPEGLELDHLCRVRACVNWQHLEPVTHVENVRRGLVGAVAGAHERAKTHCPQGHPYDEVNTYHYPRKGCRYCRTCQRERALARYYASKKIA